MIIHVTIIERNRDLRSAGVRRSTLRDEGAQRQHFTMFGKPAKMRCEYLRCGRAKRSSGVDRVVAENDPAGLEPASDKRSQRKRSSLAPSRNQAHSLTSVNRQEP